MWVGVMGVGWWRGGGGVEPCPSVPLFLTRKPRVINNYLKCRSLSIFAHQTILMDHHLK